MVVMLLVFIDLGVGSNTVVKSFDCGKLGDVLHRGGVESKMILTEGDNAVSLPLVVVLTPVTPVEKIEVLVRISLIASKIFVVFCVNVTEQIGVYVERICSVLVFDKSVHPASCPAGKTAD